MSEDQNMISPKTRLEYFLAKIAGLPTDAYGEIEPSTRIEEYLNAIAERLGDSTSENPEG